MKTNLALIKHHGISLDVIENMLPWERIIYVDLIAAKMKEEAERDLLLRNLQKDKDSLARKIASR